MTGVQTCALPISSTNLDVPVMTNAEYAKFNETSSIIVKELFEEVGGKIKKLIGSRKLDVSKGGYPVYRYARAMFLGV